MNRYSLAIDIGGTFTDAVLLSDDGRSYVDKTLTTHGDLLSGFFRGVDLVLGRAGITSADVDDVVVHATTLVTNSLIERKGPPVALILTEGFRDLLYIRDEHRYDMYDPQIEFAEPIVPAERTFTVAERTFADGSVARAADPAEISRIAETCSAKGIRSVAVCLLNSYLNGANEAEVARVFAEVAPEIHVSLSSEIAPQMREYLRASTVAINAYTVPITQPYLTALVEELRRREFRQKPLIWLPKGGVIGADRPVLTPGGVSGGGGGGGARAACPFPRLYGCKDLISFDMGGTTAKACLIRDHEPLVTGYFEVDRRYRFKPGSGMPITVPSIDMIEIGAGGGSIAWVDELGLLRVGPESAGSNPGPVCYGNGGTEPCVTDADVVLGIIDPDRFLGGDMQLDREAAAEAVGELGARLGLGREATAWGIFQVVCEQMAAAARTHATDRGIDYRGLPLLAFGGAGPVHACMVAELVDSSSVIYPPLASVLSAFGTLVSPAQIDLVRGHVAPLETLDWDEAAARIDEMVGEGTAALIEAGIPQTEVAFSFGVDMRYSGQQSELWISLPSDPRVARSATVLRGCFEVEYQKQYGLKLDRMGIEVVNWRLSAHGGQPDRQAQAAPTATVLPTPSFRTVQLRGKPVEVAVYTRSAIPVDAPVDGPVIIEERETTVFVLPGWRVRVEPAGSLVADRIRGAN